MRVYANWVRPADQRAAELSGHRLDGAAPKRGRSAPGRRARPRSRRGVARTRRAGVETVLPKHAGPQSGPLHRVSAEQLRVGDRRRPARSRRPLPTVPDLAGHCGLARSTVSRAIGLLGAEGSLVVRSGARRWATAACGADSTDADGRRLHDGGRAPSWMPLRDWSSLLPSPVEELHDESLAARECPGLPQARRPDPPGAAGQQVAQAQVQPRGGRRERAATRC